MALQYWVTMAPMPRSQQLALTDSSEEEEEESPASSKPSPDSGYETAPVRQNKSRWWRAKKSSKGKRRQMVALTLPEEVVRSLSPEVERLGLQAVFYDQYWRDVTAKNTCSITILETRSYSRTLALAMDLLVLVVNGASSGNLASCWPSGVSSSPGVRAPTSISASIARRMLRTEGGSSASAKTFTMLLPSPTSRPFVASLGLLLWPGPCAAFCGTERLQIFTRITRSCSDNRSISGV